MCIIEESIAEVSAFFSKKKSFFFSYFSLLWYISFYIQKYSQLHEFDKIVFKPSTHWTDGESDELNKWNCESEERLQIGKQ